MSMSTILDSEATFEQQANEAGLSQPWIDALKNDHMATFAKLSFAVTTPGVAATDDAITAFLNQLRPGAAITISDRAAFKRLLFESQTLMVHRLKTTVKGDDSVSRKMAPPERESRLALQRTTLRGIDIAGPLEPAHALYDLCTAMVEKNEIAYISPNKCLSRQQELLGGKPDKEIQLDASKISLVIKDQPQTQEVAIGSDLALFQAIQRRNLAMGLTGLASYEVSRKWTDRLFAMYAQSPAPGFQKVSQTQLLRADRQAFVRLAEMHTGSLQVQAHQAGKPLDPHIEKLETDMSVTYFLLPIPSGSQASSSSTGDKADKTNKKRAEPASTQSGDKPPKQPKGRGKGANKGKRREPVPQALKGMQSRTPQGEAICFGYNLGTCKLGSSCQRKHVCAVPGCYKNHPQTEHQ